MWSQAQTVITCLVMLKAVKKIREAARIRADKKEFKKKLKAGNMVVVDGDGEAVNVHALQEANEAMDESLEDGNETPYFDNNEDDDSYDEEGPDRELVRKVRKFPRFDSKAVVSHFTVEWLLVAK